MSLSLKIGLFQELGSPRFLTVTENDVPIYTCQGRSWCGGIAAARVQGGSCSVGSFLGSGVTTGVFVIVQEYFFKLMLNNIFIWGFQISLIFPNILKL